jgi:hypothetical protein
LDLAIGAGGNSVPANSRQLQLRLFVNDGHGNFSLDAEAFPLMGMNVSVMAPCDFNGDGKADLFVGGRSYPGIYGVDPVSCLLLNDGRGHFQDIAKAQNSELSHIGMVTAAQWGDVTGDGKADLIVVGEWMTPRVFSFEGGRIKEVQTNLSGLYGWWQSVAISDVNHDGRPDLILGNIGENFYLRPDKDHPVKLFINDFDGNGITDKILTYTVDGKDKPVFLKHDLEEAMPFLKKGNLKHAEYASKSVEELVPKDALSKALVKQFNYAASCVAINKGDGQFEVRKLPSMVQLSSVNAIYSIDVNGDGFMDIVTGGNQFNFQPQLERLDASLGDVLLNDGKGNFSWTGSSKAGIELRGQIRDIAEIHGRNKNYLLFLQNDAYPVLYQLNRPPGFSKNK